MTTPKRKRGRPTTLTPQAQERLLKLVISGKNFREACRTLRLRYETVIERRWTDETFRLSSARAILLGVEANIDMCEERLKRSTNKRIAVDRELAHHFRWKAAKLLSAYKPAAAPVFPLPGQGAAEKSPQSMIEFGRRLAFTLSVAARFSEQPAHLRLAKTIDVTPTEDGQHED